MSFQRPNEPTKSHLLVCVGEIGPREVVNLKRSRLIQAYKQVLLLNVQELVLDRSNDNLCTSLPRIEPRRKLNNFCKYFKVLRNSDYQKVLAVVNITKLEVIFLRDELNLSLSSLIEKHIDKIEHLKITFNVLNFDLIALINLINRCDALQCLTLEFLPNRQLSAPINCLRFQRLREFDQLVYNYSTDLIKVIGQMPPELDSLSVHLRSNCRIRTTEIGQLVHEDFDQEMAKSIQVLPHLKPSCHAELNSWFLKFSKLTNVCIDCQQLQNFASLFENLGQLSFSITRLKLLSLPIAFIAKSPGAESSCIGLNFLTINLLGGRGDHNSLGSFNWGFALPALQTFQLFGIDKECPICTGSGKSLDQCRVKYTELIKNSYPNLHVTYE